MIKLIFGVKETRLCGKINNVLCYFHKRDPVVKLKLLRSYCSDFYGSVLWDQAHKCIEDVAIAWRKGLKRVWASLSELILRWWRLFCGLLQLKAELACRCAKFITSCLNSSNCVIRLVACFRECAYQPLAGMPSIAHHSLE